MKKLAVLFGAAAVLAVAVFLFLPRSVHTEEEMLAVIAKEEEIPEDFAMRVVGSVEGETGRVLCALAENAQGNRKYFAVLFEPSGEGYRYGHSYKLHPYASSELFSVNILNHQIFFGNDPDGRYLDIQFTKGNHENVKVEIDELPFFYALDLSEAHAEGGGLSYKYAFLDEQGNDLMR